MCRNMAAPDEVFVPLRVGGHWVYDDVKKCFNFVGDEGRCAIMVANDVTFEQLKSIIHKYLNVSPVEKDIVMNYKAKTIDPDDQPYEIKEDMGVRCFLHLCARIETRSPLYINFVEKLSNNPGGCPSPVIGLDSHSPLRDSYGYNDNNVAAQFEDDVEPEIDERVDVEIDEPEPSADPSSRQSVFPGSSSTDSVNDIDLSEVFHTKSELSYRMSLFAMKNNFEYRVEKSSKSILYLKCKDSNCGWRLRATTLGSSCGWMVSKYIRDHTCTSSIMHRDHCQAKSRIIGNYIKSKYSNVKRIYRPHNIIDDIRQEFGVNIGYDKAHRSREKALDFIRGSAEESYRLLPSYMYMLKVANPGTIAEIELDESNRFRYLFMAIGACLAGFRSQMRPVIAVDACFLKGKYQGTLFVATCKDGNNQVYPIAWGVADSENDASWDWFFSKMRSAIGDEICNLAFVSDRHKSIHKAIAKNFPDAPHLACIYHISQNITAKFKKKNVHALFYKAAKAYRETEFYESFNELEMHYPEIASYLREAGLNRWARAFSEGKRFDIMTTNIAECLNAALSDARTLPVQSLMEYIRNMLQGWFFERRNNASKMADLTDWSVAEINKRMVQSRHWNPEPIDLYRFNVRDGQDGGIVDLNEKTCTCRVFQFDRFPCGHALAAARARNIDTFSLCSPYYKTEALLCAYADAVMPTGSQADWTIPNEISALPAVLPPASRRKSGRRKMRRIQSSGEETRRTKCGRCGQQGHNRQSCSNPVALKENSRPSVQEDVST